MGLVAEGVWFGCRGGSAEAAGAGRGGGEAVGGAGLRGRGGVVAGVASTAGAARSGKSVGVSSIPGDDRHLFSTWSCLESARALHASALQIRIAQVGEPTCHPSPQNARLISELKRRPRLESHLLFPLPQVCRMHP